MTLYWYNIPGFADRTVDEVVELLEPLGVTLQPARGTVHYHVDDDSKRLMKAVGAISLGVKSGRISVFPYRGIRPNPELRALLGSAEQAFHHKPARAQCWRYHRKGNRGPWWSYVVYVPCDDDDEIAVLIARDLRRVDRMTGDEIMKLMEVEA